MKLYHGSNQREFKKLCEATHNIEYDVEGPATITASFARRYCQLTVDCDEQQGYVSGGATALYEYDRLLTLTAVPAMGYDFDYWLLDGNRQDEQTITVTMDADRQLTAVLKEHENIAVGIHPSPFTLHPSPVIYNLQGMKVDKAARGVYIVDGRKVVVR